MNVQREFLQLGIADTSEPVSDCSRGKTELHARSCGPGLQPFDLACPGRVREVKPHLHPAPHCTVEKLGVVGGCDHDDVTGQFVDLQQQRADDTLDLARLVSVAAFLRYDIELVEEKNAGPHPHRGEQGFYAGRGLSQEAADESLVADTQQWDSELGGDRLGQRGFTAAWWANEQQSMSRLYAVATQQVAAVVFLDKLIDGLADLGWKDEVGDPSFGLLFIEQAVGRLVTTQRSDVRTGTRPSASQRVNELGRQHAVLLVLFLSDQRLSGATERQIITTRTRLYEREEQVCACHASSDLSPGQSSQTLCPPAHIDTSSTAAD